MQFRLVDGLPTSRQRVCELGRLSRDAAAALPMHWFSWVLPAPIRKEQSVCGCARADFFRGGQFLRKLNAKTEGLHTSGEFPYLSFFALLCKDRAFEDYMVRRAKAFLAERTGRVFFECPGSTVVHP
eukprot:4662590-Amphidinium_carterae.1